jgi:hypothetical protein
MSQKEKPRPEREFDGPIWKHPYALYILLTAILFIFLVLAAWLAIENHWLPT